MSQGAVMPETTSVQPPAAASRRPLATLVDPAIRLEVLDAAALDRIHAATLELIETVGVRFPSTRAQAIWADHGAQVDPATGIVRVPGHVIDAALRSAPAAFTLAGRDPGRDLPLDGHHVWAATDGCGVEVADPTTGERRRSTLDDVTSICRVAEELPDVGFIWMPVSAQDVAPETRALRELAAALGITTKHVQTESVMHAREAAVAVEMALALAGSRAALRARPPLSLTFCTISPLAHEAGALDAALVAAEAGIPTGFMTMASCAHTGPATLAGTLAVGNAEVLSALALVAAGLPRRARLLRRRADRDGPADRRVHGRRPGGRPVRDGLGRAGGPLSRAALHGRVRDRRARARLAGRPGERAGGARRVRRPGRHAPGHGPAGRQPDLVVRAAPARRRDPAAWSAGSAAASRWTTSPWRSTSSAASGPAATSCPSPTPAGTCANAGARRSSIAAHPRPTARRAWMHGSGLTSAALELLATAPGAPLDPALAAELVRIADTAGEPGR